MKKVKIALLLGITIGVFFTSCSNDNEQMDKTTVEQTTNPLSKKIPQRVIEAVANLEMNVEHIRYDTFYFPDGTSEERLFLEEDIAMTEEKLLRLSELKSNSKVRQYSTDNLVAQGKNITIIGFTGGGGFGLSSNEQKALKWAVNNYNRLSGVSISFTLSFGTNLRDKDMVVFNDPYRSGTGGKADFPSGGLPNKWVQIYGMSGVRTDEIEHVITHEIGHSIGFRHTDWFNRASCGESIKEPDAGVGINHITGTPTGYDATSIMLACVPADTDGEFNENDIKALQNMY